MPFPDPDTMWAAHKVRETWEALVPRLMGVCRALEDQESKDYVLSVMDFYLSDDYSRKRMNTHPKLRRHYGYVAPGANPKSGAVIVDCGAYLGEIWGEFVYSAQNKCTIHAIEPLGASRAQRGVHWYSCAVGAERKTAVIDPHTHPSRAHIVEEGTRKIPMETLDYLFRDTKVDYIKIDVEGSDLDALKGGEAVLRRDRPVVVACGYHAPEHMAAIPEFLLRVLEPCKLYAAHDPHWLWHTHYIAVPNERAN